MMQAQRCGCLHSIPARSRAPSCGFWRTRRGYQLSRDARLRSYSELAPIPLFEGQSRINGPMLVAQVPDDPQVPEHLRGSKLLYVGQDARLCGVHRPLGDPHPMTTKVWDFFVILPLLVPDGPMGVLGWGGGTAVRLIMETFTDPPPFLVWEEDLEMMELCQAAFGSKELGDTGQVQLTVGDPLGEEVSVPRGFSAVIVDFMRQGALPEELTRVETWRRIRSRLADPKTGRVMVRLGSPCSVQGGREQLRLDTILAANAIHEAFDGELQIQDVNEGGEEDIMALTGPPLDTEAFAAALGPELLPLLVDWEPWQPVDVGALLAAAQQQPEWPGDIGGSGSSSSSSSSSSGGSGSSSSSRSRSGSGSEEEGQVIEPRGGWS